MSTTVAPLPVDRERTEAVAGLFDALIRFSRSLKARGGDWSNLAHDLTRGDIVTLGVVAAHGSIRPGHIAAKLGVDASVVSRQLAGLHRLGLVERGPDPDDRRAELITLTADGEARLTEARQVLCRALAERLDHWDVTAVLEAAAMVDDLGLRLQQPLVPAPHPEPSATPVSTATTAPVKEVHV